MGAHSLPCYFLYLAPFIPNNIVGPTLPLHLPISSLLLLLCFLSPPYSSALTSDGLSLIALKAAVARGRVASLFPAGKNGYILSEVGLPSFRVPSSSTNPRLIHASIPPSDVHRVRRFLLKP